MSSTHYVLIADLWKQRGVPPITRIEAERAARKLCSHFGRKSLGSVYQVRDLTCTKARRCWISTVPNPDWGATGWQRLVHDVSHMVFRARHPNFRPHDGGHAVLELEMVQYVIEQGWLGRKLLPPVKPKLKGEALQKAKIEKLGLQVRRWETKAKRAKTAISKLNRRRNRLIKQLYQLQTTPQVFLPLDPKSPDSVEAS